MIAKRRVDKEELEQMASDMCKYYCRFPLLWDEDVMQMELAEADICKYCPMKELVKSTLVDERR